MRIYIGTLPPSHKCRQDRQVSASPRQYVSSPFRRTPAPTVGWSLFCSLPRHVMIIKTHISIPLGTYLSNYINTWFTTPSFDRPVSKVGPPLLHSLPSRPPSSLPSSLSLVIFLRHLALSRLLINVPGLIGHRRNDEAPHAPRSTKLDETTHSTRHEQPLRRGHARWSHL